MSMLCIFSVELSLYRFFLTFSLLHITHSAPLPFGMVLSPRSAQRQALVISDFLVGFLYYLTTLANNAKTIQFTSKSCFLVLHVLSSSRCSRLMCIAGVLFLQFAHSHPLTVLYGTRDPNFQYPPGQCRLIAQIALYSQYKL
jgi:hypothetical protein